MNKGGSTSLTVVRGVKSPFIYDRMSVIKSLVFKCLI